MWRLAGTKHSKVGGPAADGPALLAPWATSLTMAVACLALAGCKRPQWATPEKPPEPQTVAAAAAEANEPASHRAVQTLPEWARGLIGRNPRAAFPRNGACIGNSDGIGERFAGPPAGVKVFGWGWDVAAKRPVRRVVMVDAAYVIIGAGEGGIARKDVAKARPEFGATAGWAAVTGMTRGPVDVYGIVENGSAICPLGHLEL